MSLLKTLLSHQPMRLRRLPHLVIGSSLVLLLSGPLHAYDYCKQGQPALTKTQAQRYDRYADLTSAEKRAAIRQHLPWGVPPCDRYLYHREYILCYDPVRRVASWASYRLERRDIKSADRVNAFRSDSRIADAENPPCADYLGTPFDRGHLVPRNDMARSKNASVNTFFLTNMMPQYPSVNRGTWARLEQHVQAWARDYKVIHVLSGSIFDYDNDGRPDPPPPARRTRKPSSSIGVPSQFYKAVLRRRASGDLEAIVFLLPNLGDKEFSLRSTSVAKDGYLRRHLTTLAQVRALTGVDLLPDLPAGTKASLEALKSSTLWKD